MLNLSLSLLARRCNAAVLNPPVAIPPVSDIPDDPGPIEDDPDWDIPPDPTPDPDPEPPPLVVTPGHVVAQTRLEENGVAYRNVNAGPKDKKVRATLEEVTQTQGLIAPLVKDQDNYIGTTYDVAAGKLKAVKKVAGVESTAGDVTISVQAGDDIGALVKGDSYYITLNDVAVAGAFPVPAVLKEKPPGLVAKGPATSAWISSFSVSALSKGFGGSYGFGYGSAL